MAQKKLIEKLIKVSNEIDKNRTGKAEYITLSEDYIQQKANEHGISFDEMVKIIEEELKFKK
jgi:hypothetical protein